MLVLIFVLLLTAEIGHAIQCISNCTLGEFRFDEPFPTSYEHCQHRASATECTIRIHLNYHDRTYNVELGRKRSSANFIYINSSPYLTYSINYHCSKGSECVFENIQEKINKMVSHSYNVEQISRELAPLIENSSPTDTIQCYNIENEIVTCAHDEVCGLSYDQQTKTLRARGCEFNHGSRIFVYDASYYSALHFDCNRNLCNDDLTLANIISILAANELVNNNGRTISSGTKEIISFYLFIFTLIFVIISYL